MKKKKIVEIISGLLLVFYVHSLISNYVQMQSLKNMLSFYTVNTSLFAWVIIIMELMVSCLLFFTGTRGYGLLASSLFVIVVIVVSFLSPHNPHDFGGLVNSLANKHKLILGVSVLIVSLTAFLLQCSALKIKRRKGSGSPNVVFT